MTQDLVAERVRAGFRAAMYALVVLAPLPFGSVQPWAVLAIELIAAGMGLGALVVLWREPEALPRRVRWLLVPCAVVVAVGVLQLAPLPEAWTAALVPPTARARAAVAAVVPQAAWPSAPASISPPDTIDALLRFVGCVLIGLGAALSLTERRHLRGLAVAIVGSGAFQGLYGSAEYLSGHQHIFGYAKKYYLESATGTFINRNHYAGFLAMCLPFALGLLLESAGHRRGDRDAGAPRRARLLYYATAPGVRFLLGAFATFVIAAGIVLSYSRAGLVVAMLGVGSLAWLARLRGRNLLALGAVVAVPLLWLAMLQVGAPGERFLDASAGELQSIGSRLPAWRATLEIIEEYPWIGTGLGTFEAAFVTFQPPEVSYRWDHAHNDPLEFVSDDGIPGAVTLLIGAGLGFTFLIRSAVIRPLGDPAVPVPVASSLGVIFAHALVDFPLRIPALGLVTTLVIGAALAGLVVYTPKTPARRARSALADKRRAHETVLSRDPRSPDHALLLLQRSHQRFPLAPQIAGRGYRS